MNQVNESEIARRAYQIWESEGRPNGRDLDHWLRAETELNAKTSSHRALADPPAQLRRRKSQHARKG